MIKNRKNSLASIVLGTTIMGVAAFAGTNGSCGGTMDKKCKDTDKKCIEEMMKKKSGSCGGDMKKKPGSCGGDMKKKSGSCGGEMSGKSGKKSGSCGAGKCGAMK